MNKLRKTFTWIIVYALEYHRQYVDEVREGGQKYRFKEWGDDAAALADSAVEHMQKPEYETKNK